MSSSILPVHFAPLLEKDFQPSAYASSLVQATNNASDTTLDLSTPLSKVLFDQQEIDSLIHTLTSTHASSLLSYTSSRQQSAERILGMLTSQLETLNAAHSRLKTSISDRHAEAQTVRVCTENLWKTVRMLRAVARAVQLARQLEIHLSAASSLSTSLSPSSAASNGEKQDARALPLAAATIVSLKQFLEESREGKDACAVKVVAEIRDSMAGPVERQIRAKAAQLVREFSISNANPSSTSSTTSAPSPGATTGKTQTFAQIEELKARTLAAATTLALLSRDKDGERHLAAAVGAHIQSAVTFSSQTIIKALSSMNMVDTAFAAVSLRCRNLVILSSILASAPHPQAPPSESLTATAAPLATTAPTATMLAVLLTTMDTSSLMSYFWRSLASTLSSKITDLGRSPAVVRYMRTNKNNLRQIVKDCVLNGVSETGSSGKALPPTPSSMGPAGGIVNAAAASAKARESEKWDREVAVMVGAVVGNIR